MLAAMLCLGTADALANCATVGTTVTCATPGTTGFVAGGGVNGLNVTVQPGTTVVDNGTDAIQINANSTVTNNGTITAGASAAGIVSLSGDTNTVINNGTITVTSNGVAIFLNNSSNITNAGTIVGTNGTGINVGSTNTVINSGTITMGLGGYAISGTNNNVITNAGTMTVGANGRGVNAGNNNTIANTGSIVSGANGYSIIATSNNTIGNSGSITTGTDGNGIWVNSGNAVTNTGSIVGGPDAAGIFALDNNTITNNRTIVVGNTVAPNAGGGIVARNGDTIVNNGTIVAGDSSGVISNGGDAVRLTNNDIFTNNGTVTTGAYGLSLWSSLGNTANANTIVNNGTLDGAIFLASDGGGTSSNIFTNSGLIEITNAGTPPTTHRIDGSFTQTATGTLALRVGTTNTSDKLNVIADAASDSVVLNGTLRAVVQSVLYQATTAYSGVVTFCSCFGGSIQGTFAQVTTSSPFFTAIATYTANQVNLTLTRIPFGSVPGLTPDQKATGSALEAKYSPNLTGNAATFYSNLFVATSTGALDQLSGQGVSVSQNVAFDTESMFNNTMMSQGAFWLSGNPVDADGVSFAPLAFAQNDPRGNANATSDASHAASYPGRWRVWTLGFGSSSSLSGEASTGSVTQTLQSAGGSVGIDHEISPDLLVGAAIGASSANFSAPSLATSGQSTAVHLGVYGSKTWGPFYLASALNYTHFDNTTTRAVSGIGTTETESGKFASNEVGTRLELGWKRGLGAYTVTPFVAIEPSAQFQNGYTESSLTVNNTPGILGLTYAPHTTTSVPTSLGMQLDALKTFDNGWTLAPFIRTAWVHEFTPDRQVSASFVSVPSASFTVQGPRAPSDAARIDTGVTLGFDKNWALYANFTGDFSDRSHGYAGTGGFRASW